MNSQDAPSKQPGLSPGISRGGGMPNLTIAEEFWLVMARNDRSSAEQIVAWLEVPPVVVSSYLFEFIESEEGKVGDPEARHQEEVSGTLTPTGVSVMPDTPTEAVTVWNSGVLVALVAVSKSEICGA
jgi:hypothetical protein